MQYLPVILFAVTTSGTMTLAADVLQSNQALIASVKQSLGVDAINAFPDPAPILGKLEMNGDFQKLIAESAHTWDQALSNLSAVAPDRASRVVLLHSFLYLPPKEYMKCLQRVLDFFQDGKIPRDEFVYIFWLSPRDENDWFLSFNYTNTQMVGFLKRIQIAFKDDKEILAGVDFIASGRAKTRDGWLRREDPGLLKRKIPLLAEQ